MALTNDQAVAVLNERLDAQDRQLARILDQALKTNGRVTKLEQDKVVESAVKIALGARRVQMSGFMKGLVFTAAGSAFGSFAYLLFNH